MKDFLTNLLIGSGILLAIAYGIALFILGYIGIEAYLGTGWAIGFLIASVMFKFSLPMTIGAVYGAMIVLGVNVWIAILIVIPSIAFMIPALLVVIISPILESFRKPKQTSAQTDSYIDTTIVE